MKEAHTDVSNGMRDTGSGVIYQGRLGNLPTLFKAYHKNDDRYSGATVDNFERKYALFVERCDQSDICEEERRKAFSIMIFGAARQYYFDSLKVKGLYLPGLVEAVKERFYTSERTCTLLREWDAIFLSSVMARNIWKEPSECLDSLLNRLQDIQLSLPSEYKNDTIIRNKLLNSVKDVESCKLAYFKPAPTLGGVISDLYASVATMKKAERSLFDAHFVERRYHRPFDKRRKKKACFVCKKEGCWSTNHTKEERMASLRKSTALRGFFTQMQRNDSDDEE